MVSALWKASSEGRLEDVHEILKTATGVDVNVKDHTGVTPLILAVQNGHIEVVQVLLAHGADPFSASSQGPPHSYTQDPNILEILNAAHANSMSAAPPNENGFYPEANGDAYPPPPPAPYPFYPAYNPSPPEGPVYYPQPHAEGQPMTAPGPGNLPPPEIARLIPCRYYPACRYGTSCYFAHPQGPYLSGPLPPPAQYPAPYDPMNANYPPNYYPMPPPSFQPPPPPNGMNPLLSPTNGPPPSEMVPPPQPFSPNGPPPASYAAVSPVGSPSPYPQPGPLPMTTSPLPPVYHQPLTTSAATLPPAMYNGTSPPAPFTVQTNGVPQYPPVPLPLSYPDDVTESPPLNPQPDAYTPSGPPGPPRETAGHIRRGSMRRGSFGSRKPPCIFYPAGRCKNGDDCRFPHVLPADFPPQHGSPFAGRGGAPRASRGHFNNGSNANGLDTKMAALSVRDTRPQNGHAPEKPELRAGNRPQGFKNGPNGSNNHRRPPPPMKQQRVPNADEFPVLGNLASPSAKSSSANGYFPSHNGPTAAQILQAPAPPRKDAFPMANGTHTSSESGSVKDFEANVGPQPSLAATQKLPISFATIAANGSAEMASEVSVSA
ncbi:hypothetical protein BT96DRAFT_992853 [Gymnopus androsaceus JB14]|uniref:C3H1-type domain-containing protein n=1 Tax=Gymnopus androsaceus JB14 TaxID=1447944 RepID=A0A6A4HTA6_9AGAR|nr:hypothetical protein BT96DRAFT_992853 [Gymnopus androsaceus JB14]